MIYSDVGYISMIYIYIVYEKPSPIISIKHSPWIHGACSWHLEMDEMGQVQTLHDPGLSLKNSIK
jgi:hypothetical protein